MSIPYLFINPKRWQNKYIVRGFFNPLATQCPKSDMEHLSKKKKKPDKELLKVKMTNSSLTHNLLIETSTSVKWNNSMFNLPHVVIWSKICRYCRICLFVYVSVCVCLFLHVHEGIWWCVSSPVFLLFYLFHFFCWGWSYFFLSFCVFGE